MSFEYFTRVHSPSSAEKLVSGRGGRGLPLREDALLAQFGRHRFQKNRIPTALVSTSSRMIDSIQRALSMVYEGREDPNKVFIVFIVIPTSDGFRPHSAQILAERLGLTNAGAFQYEYIFEWKIPSEYIVHAVSVQTLLDRGFPVDRFVDKRTKRVLSTSEAREKMGKALLEGSYGLDLESDLSSMARCFGVRAPGNYIANRLLQDCSYNYGGITVVIKSKGLSYQINREDVKEGISTFLVDGWLLHSDFLASRGAYLEWIELMEDLMVDAAIDCYENGATEDKVNKYYAKQEDICHQREAYALEIGL